MNIELAKTIMWLALSVLFAVGGVALAYALWRVGRMLRRIERDLTRTVDEVVPVIAKTGVSMDTVNTQLEKVDVMLDSAVDMTESLDTAVRAMSMAVVEPVKKVSGAVAGVGEAVVSFRDRMSDDAGLDRTHAAHKAPEPSTSSSSRPTGADA